MRASLTLLIWLAGAAGAAAQTSYLSKGWTFDEPDGASLYAHVCSACHQENGEGATGAGSYPALQGDERLTSTDYLLAVLLGGQRAMPALGRAMSDAQLADLVNYVKRRFAGVTDEPATTAKAGGAGTI